MSEVLQIENISKQYRLGHVGTGTLSHDLNRWWHRLRGHDDPYSMIGVVNNRNEKGGDYVWALRDVSFNATEGDVIGIIGRNGAGKSTLLKIISQITTPTTGLAKIKGRIASLLEVGTGFHPELTGRENIYLNAAILGMTRSEVNKRLDEIIDFSGCAKYVDTPVKRYSSGMMVRLGFAVAAHLEPEILVVDEVLAVGDAEFQKKCIGKMQDVAGSGRTILFVSHNMASVRSLCNKGILLNQGRVVCNGNIEKVISNYLDEGASNEKKYDNGVVKKIVAQYGNQGLHIEVCYESDSPLALPNFGFVVSDQFGHALYGNNAKNLGYPMNSGYASSGTISILVTQPQLRDGSYTLSAWFGDGGDDSFQDNDCLRFEVISTKASSINVSSGFIQNECIYTFY
ncbi:MAG: ABC transporter ATP-binding protein [Flavobacteriales bacterium]